LQTRKWQDQNSVDRWTTEIIVSDMQILGGRRRDDTERYDTVKAHGAGVESTALADSSDSDIPF